MWIASSDGSGVAQVDAQVGFLGPWSPDSQWITYGRLTFLEQPTHPRVRYRTDLERINPVTHDKTLLLTDEESYGVQPLGWSADSHQFLLARIAVNGAWTIHIVDAASGRSTGDKPLPVNGQVRSVNLSADGLHVLVESVRAGQDQLNLYDLDPAQPLLQAQPTLASGPISDQTPVSPVSGLWSARDGRIWLFQRPQPGVTPQTWVLSVQRGSISVIYLQPVRPNVPDVILLPASWSPDEQWFIWRQYPKLYSTVFLQANGQETLTPISLDRPENWMTIFGWIPAAAGSGQ